MQLHHENTLKFLTQFLSSIHSKPDSWRVISIEFQDHETLHTGFFQNLCLTQLQHCFEQTEARIFWIREEHILICFQGRALPIEKCVENFFKALEFQGFGKFFDIFDLSIHWEMFLKHVAHISNLKFSSNEGRGRETPLSSPVSPEQAVRQSPQTKTHHSQDPPVSESKNHGDDVFKIELNAAKIKQLRSQFGARLRPVILLVEDDAFTLQLIKLAIKDDFEVVTAETARQAIIYYQRHLPDIVLLDIQLPDGNGIEILQQISRTDPHGYVVMLSSHTQKEKIIECQSGGAKGFIGKPFTRQRITDAMGKFLQQRPGSSSASGKSGKSGATHGT